MVPYPSTDTAFGIWSLNEIRDARRGDNWPKTDPIVTSITRSVSTADEGDTVTFTINTLFYPDGSTLYYDITGSGITTGDFTDSTLSGSFTITSNTGTISKTITEDNTTEGTETFTFNVRIDSVSGTVLDSSSVTINDTSVTPSLTTDTQYGTMVAAFEGDWEPTSGVSVTTGTPQESSSNVVLSDSEFQSVRSNTTDNRVYYVWGSNLDTYVAFARTDIESANVEPAPTNTINPTQFGKSTRDYYVHFWDENSGSSLVGSDYSFVGYRDTDELSLFDFSSSIKSVDSNTNTTNNNSPVPKFYIFYK